MMWVKWKKYIREFSSNVEYYRRQMYQHLRGCVTIDVAMMLRVA